MANWSLTLGVDFSAPRTYRCLGCFEHFPVPTKDAPLGSACYGLCPGCRDAILADLTNEQKEGR